MGQVLIVEDNVSDIRNAAAALKSLGVSDVEAVSHVADAIARLQNAVDGLQPVPYLVLLDLDFSRESGFEVLRFWKSHPELKATQVVVWTSMGQTEMQLSRYFGVEVVPKGSGAQSYWRCAASLFPRARATMNSYYGIGDTVNGYLAPADHCRTTLP